MTSTGKSEFYNPWAEHSKEDIDLVNRLEDAEQKRRIMDVLGEQQRRYVANQVAEIISTNLRPSWFLQGSAYVFSLLNVAKNAGNDLLRSSQVRAMSTKLQVVGHKGLETAAEVKHKVEEVGLRAQETSKLKLQDTLDSAGGIAHQGLEKVQEVAQKIKDMSLSFFGKFNQAWSNLSENTNLAFAVLEEENERQWRLNSELEAYAILNALCISNLLKETAPALYRPAIEPSRKYSTRLIEEYERNRRCLQDAADHTSLQNASAISRLILQKFAVVSAPIRKVEVVEAPRQKSTLGAAQ